MSMVPKTVLMLGWSRKMRVQDLPNILIFLVGWAK